MTLSGNLLYLLLLYAVLDKQERISPTTGLLVALGIMLYGTCRTAINVCCNTPRQGHNSHCNNGNYGYANYNNAGYNNASYNHNCNPHCNNFWAVNNLF